MANLGNFSLMLALALAIFGTIAALLAATMAKERLRLTAVRAFSVSCGLVLLAVICLGWLLQKDIFSIVYVHGHSNLHLPQIYKLTAVWAGSSGSLLWWTLILCVYATVFLVMTRKLPRLMTSWAMFFVGLNLVFFMLINNVVSNPFNTWSQMGPDGIASAFMPQDGRGLNPQLQHWAMIIHPPLLYTGYIGFLFPFSLALGALITRMEGREWIPLVRRWTLSAWLILGVGIVLGGAWAYMELGWGGYWAWDPVENASFMPWLIATAFIHSIMAQERRGMFKLWNILLLMATYLMCLFGTFITRSGLISSVHAFAESDIGYWFGGFIVVLFFICVVVLILRRNQFADDNSYTSFRSREVSLLFNNILFISICFTMLLATIYPMVTEYLEGTKRELRHGFYNTVELPIFMMLLVLMGIGPVLTWKRTSGRLLRERFLWPTVIMVVVVASCLTLGMVHEDIRLYPSLAAGALSFLACTIVHEFVEVTMRRSKRAGENLFAALVSLVRLNKRRYGGYIVHLGILIMAIGITGGAFNQQAKEELGMGETMTVAGYDFQVENIGFRTTDNYEAMFARVNMMRDGKVVQRFDPDLRFYKASQSQASEVAINSTLSRDFYIVLAGPGEGSSQEHPIAVFHIYVNPLVVWVWIGTLILIFGTAIAMTPDAVRQRAKSSVPESMEAV